MIENGKKDFMIINSSKDITLGGKLIDELKNKIRQDTIKEILKLLPKEQKNHKKFFATIGYNKCLFEIIDIVKRKITPPNN